MVQPQPQPGKGGTNACQKVSSQSSPCVQRQLLHPWAWFHFRESAKLLVPMEIETWAGTLPGEGVQEITLLPGSPWAGKELKALGNFAPVQRRSHSENRFFWFCHSENSPVNSLGLPNQILIAKISHKLRVYFSFAKVLFSNAFN